MLATDKTNYNIEAKEQDVQLLKSRKYIVLTENLLPVVPNR
jgi:hypothetical protein